MKKTLVLLLCLLLILTGASASAQETPVTITALLGVDTMPSDNASVIQEIRDRTGIDFQPTFVSNGDYNERLNAMISGGNLPDIFYFNASTGTELIGYQAILPLDDLLAAHGQNILSNREGDLDWGLNGQGVIYAIPDIPSYPFAMAVRKDWMANLGMEVPEERIVTMTMDEFYEILHAFTYNDPDQDGVQDTFGMCFAMKGLGMMYPIMNAYNCPMNGYFLDADGIVRSYIKHEGFLEGIEFMRKLYAEGLFDPDFLTVPDSTAEFNNLWNGTAGAASWGVAGITNNWLGRYVEGIPADNWLYVDLKKDETTGGGYYINYYDHYLGIAASCAHPEAAMDLLNFFYSEEGEELIYFGIEGKHFQWTDKDAMQYEYLGDYKDSAIQRADGGYVVWQQIRPLESIEIRTLTSITQEIIAYANAHPAAEGVHFYGVPASASELGSTLNDLISEMIATLIVEEGDVQAKYDEYIAKYNEIGGALYEEQATEIYQAENGIA